MMFSEKHIPESDEAGKQNMKSRNSASMQKNKTPLPSTHQAGREISPAALQQHLLTEFFTQLRNLESNRTSPKFSCGNSESDANSFLAEIHRSYENACKKGLEATYLQELTKAIDQSLYHLLRRILVENHTWEQAKELIRTLCSPGR